MASQEQEKGSLCCVRALSPGRAGEEWVPATCIPSSVLAWVANGCADIHPPLRTGKPCNRLGWYLFCPGAVHHGTSSVDCISADAGEHPPGSKSREPTGTWSRRHVVPATVLEWIQHRFPRRVFFAVLETLEDTHMLLLQTFFGNHFFHKHL